MVHMGLAPLVGFFAVATTHAATIPASTASWIGRRLVNAGDGSVTIDWEGAEASIRVSGATYVTATIRDTSKGHSRFAVTVNATGIPNLRLSTLITSSQVQDYVLASGSWITSPTYIRLTLLTEFAYIGDSATGNLTIVSFDSDGSFDAAPVLPQRRIEYLGDSLTAGMDRP